MERNLHSDNIIPLHRGATARADHLAVPPVGQRVGLSTHSDRPANFAWIADRLNGPPRHVTVERIAGTVGQRTFDRFVGFYAGCMATVGLAAVWSMFL